MRYDNPYKRGSSARRMCNLNIGVYMLIWGTEEGTNSFLRSRLCTTKRLFSTQFATGRGVKRGYSFVQQHRAIPSAYSQLHFVTQQNDPTPNLSTHKKARTCGNAQDTSARPAKPMKKSPAKEPKLMKAPHSPQHDQAHTKLFNSVGTIYAFLRARNRSRAALTAASFFAFAAAALSNRSNSAAAFRSSSVNPVSSSSATASSPRGGSPQ